MRRKYIQGMNRQCTEFVALLSKAKQDHQANEYMMFTRYNNLYASNHFKKEPK